MTSTPAPSPASQLPSPAEPPPSAPASSTQTSGVLRFLHRAEDSVLAITLSLMVLIPLIEAVCRKLSWPGISNAAGVTQHLGLVVAMLGGSVAARHRRLLSISTLEFVLKDPWLAGARFVAGVAGGAVTLALVVGSVILINEERLAPKTLAYSIPTWVVQLVQPLGFVLIALRLLFHAASTWRWRAAAAAGAGALLALGLLPAAWLPNLSWGLYAGLFIAAVLGAPLFAILGGLALVLFFLDGVSVAVIPLTQYSLVVNPTLPTIPLFTLAGYFLAEGGASHRLVRVFQTLLGRLRGGPAVVTALVCAFFTSFTGASGVTILALGGLLMPVLLQARYPERQALGLLTGAGSLGLLLPPCLPVILYAILADIPIEKMFLGGLIPGTLLVVMTALWGVYTAPPVTEKGPIFQWREAGSALWAAKWELGVPAVALAGLFGGFATPVEAAALTALYAFFIEVILHGDLKLTRDVPRVMAECALLVGGVLLILGVALGFTNYLIDADVPSTAMRWVQGSVSSPLMFLLLLNVFLLIVGCLMDVYSAIIVLVPLLKPLGEAYGIDPVHLGIIFLANLELGFLTPPVGMNLFLASYRFNKPMLEVARATLPILLVLLTGVLLITYVPAMTTWLPSVLSP